MKSKCNNIIRIKSQKNFKIWNCITETCMKVEIQKWIWSYHRFCRKHHVLRYSCGNELPRFSQNPDTGVRLLDHRFPPLYLRRFRSIQNRKEILILISKNLYESEKKYWSWFRNIDHITEIENNVQQTSAKIYINEKSNSWISKLSI